MDQWNAEEFEAEISRRLEEEHKRREEESAAKEKAAQAEEDEAFKLPPVPEDTASTESEEAVDEPFQPQEVSETLPATAVQETKPAAEDSGKYSAELSAIMQAESDRQKQHVALEETQNADSLPIDEEAEDVPAQNSGLPMVVRLIFTLLLLGCGAAGMYIMTVVRYPSPVINVLCFAEIASCLLGALGLNTSDIGNRLLKSLIMKTAALGLFGFYCLYVLWLLSMMSLLRGGTPHVDWLALGREGISFRVFSDIARMGSAGMLACGALVIPFAFFVLVLVRPLRNVGWYFPGMGMLLLAAGTLRFITNTGVISLAQCVIGLVGAAVAYMLFMLPPLQNLMRRSGLIGWAKVIDDD